MLKSASLFSVSHRLMSRRVKEWVDFSSKECDLKSGSWKIVCGWSTWHVLCVPLKSTEMCFITKFWWRVICTTLFFLTQLTNEWLIYNRYILPQFSSALLLVVKHFLKSSQFFVMFSQHREQCLKGKHMCKIWRVQSRGWWENETLCMWMEKFKYFPAEILL